MAFVEISVESARMARGPYRPKSKEVKAPRSVRPEPRPAPTEPVDEELGDAPTKLAEWRIHRGMTQAQLSARSGVSESVISTIEGGGGYSNESLGRLARALGCTKGDILSYGPNDRPPDAIAEQIKRLNDDGRRLLGDMLEALVARHSAGKR